MASNTPESGTAFGAEPTTGYRAATVSPGSPPNGAHAGPVAAATTPELVGRIINDFSELVDKQIELAKQEVKEDIGQAVGAAKTLAIGAGIAAATGLLLLIWFWTAFIWFFNYLGGLLAGALGTPVFLGGVLQSLGWILGLLVPAVVLYFVGYRRFIRSGIQQAKIKPLARTRTTLKENAEWIRNLRSPNGR